MCQIHIDSDFRKNLKNLFFHLYTDDFFQINYKKP